MKKRAISSIFIMLAIVLAIASKFIVSEIFDIFVAVIGVVGALEMCNMYDKRGMKHNRFLSSMFIIEMYLTIVACISLGAEIWQTLLAMIGVFAVYGLIIAIIELVADKTMALEKTINSLKVMLYPSAFLSIFFIINHIEAFTPMAIKVPYFSFILIVYIWGIAILSDTFAYLVGSSLHGPKLCPKVSPNKTWSGAIGGVIGGVVMGVVTYFIIKNVASMSIILTSTNINLASLMISGALGSAVSQIGDIWESLLKRKAGIKDSGNFIPGHGGMLDRVDALMFCLVFVGGILMLLI